MANPDPEITPPDAKAARPDAIIATGRSDYPNQVNNVLGFPFIFRGALDVRATGDQRGDEDRRRRRARRAGARAGAGGSRRGLWRRSHSFGPDYIIPAPFDPRLMEIVPSAVAQAAMDSGVAQKPIEDMRRLSPAASRRGSTRPPRCSASPMKRRGRTRSACCSPKARRNVLRAAIAFRKAATARRCWSAARTSTTSCASSASTIPKSFEVLNSRNSPLVGRAVDYLYAKHQRRGMLRREVERMVNQDRNIFAAACSRSARAMR